MRLFLSSFLLLVSVFAMAIPPVLSLESIGEHKSGETVLGFKFDGSTKKTNVHDSNGMTTLATIHFMLMQEASDELFFSKKKDPWSTYYEGKVKGWTPEVGRLIARSLFSLLGHIDTNQEGANAQIKKLINMAQLGEAPTYEELNELGSFIDKHYNELVDLKAVPTLETALKSRPRTLPPLALSKSAATIRGDLPAIASAFYGEVQGRRTTREKRQRTH